MWIRTRKIPDEGLIVTEDAQDIALLREAAFPPQDPHSPESLRKLYCGCCMPKEKAEKSGA